MRLDGKVALITGGGTGIGAAIASRFVADGAKVCISGRRQQVLDEFAQSLPAGRVISCAGDISKPQDIERIVRTTAEWGGRLDVLVNNAATESRGGILDTDLALWHKVLDTNLTGPFLLMKESIPHMTKGGGGSVINISSLSGIRCLPSHAAYDCSKAALIHLTRQAALDYGIYKIRCNAVCPGAVRTPLVDDALALLAPVAGMDIEGLLRHLSKDIPLRRVAQPEEISGLCSYLASDDSSFMTGSALVIDGGTAIVDISGAALSNLLPVRKT
jgi:meso-butanediol dehydrogenase / (S,S)-butanediol dehydrogenase / diacetyl reductase